MKNLLLPFFNKFNSNLSSSDLKLKELIPFDSDSQYPVIKCSICNGEQLAGFKNKINGTFTEVMLIKSDNDINRFKKIYGINEIQKEY